MTEGAGGGPTRTVSSPSGAVGDTSPWRGRIFRGAASEHQNACPIEMYTATLGSPLRRLIGVARSTRNGPKLV